MKISIIICTYNRADILDHCLQSLCNQTAPNSAFEVLVINNNSTDHTSDIAKKYIAKQGNFKLIIEKEQGLSHARNRGYKETKADWIIYLDDDAKARPNLVERAIWVTENNDLDCFGGLYLPWYKFGQPIWFKDKYASNKMKYSKLSEIKNHQHISGGIMAFKSDILQKYNGFSTDLGMNGNKVAYGEETELQLRMRNDGIKIYYDPELIIDHLVPEYKLNLSWFFISAFALGRDQIEMGIEKDSYFNLLTTFIIGLGLTFLSLLYYTPKLLKKDYYIQNWMLDVFKKAAKRIGVLYTALISKSEQKHASA